MSSGTLYCCGTGTRTQVSILPGFVCCPRHYGIKLTANLDLPREGKRERSWYPLFLKDTLAGYSILGWQAFPPSTLNASSHTLLTSQVSAENRLVALWGFSCMWGIFFFLLLLLKRLFGVDFTQFRYNVSWRRCFCDQIVWRLTSWT